MAETTGHMTI